MTAPRVTGGALADHQFRLHQTRETVDVNAVFEVLSGRLAAYRIGGFIADRDCRLIIDNWAAAHPSPRYGDGEDGVEAYIVGASHIQKTTDTYLGEVEKSAEAVCELYRATSNPIASFWEQLAGRTGLIRIRAAARDGRAAGKSKAVSWNKSGTFLLLPHDDVAQLSDPLQAGFEIQDVRRVMAVNAYPKVTAGGGQLKLWNVEPDDASRERLGLTASGFPYPPELLEEHPSMIVPVATGDLCVINGNLIHAVLGTGPVSADDGRLLLTCFSGMRGHDELLWWT